MITKISKETAGKFQPWQQKASSEKIRVEKEREFAGDFKKMRNIRGIQFPLIMIEAKPAFA